MKTEIRVVYSKDQLTKKTSDKIKCSDFAAVLTILYASIVGVVITIADDPNPEGNCSLYGIMTGKFIYASITIISYGPCENIVDWGNRCKILRIFGINYLILAVLSLLTLYTWSLRPKEDLIITNESNCSAQQLIEKTTLSFATLSVLTTLLFWVRRKPKVVKMLMLCSMTIAKRIL